MRLPAFGGRQHQRSRMRLDFWSGMMVLALGVIGILLVWPIVQVLKLGFLDPDTQAFTLANYIKVLTHPYYLGAAELAMALVAESGKELVDL